MTWAQRLWIDPPPVEINDALQQAIGGHPLVAQTLQRRGLLDVPAARGFLDPTAYVPCPPEQLPDMEKAVSLLADAIQARQHICVWGDFDVDGQTSTTVLVSTLRSLGAQATYHIPVRAQESHGVNLPVLQSLIEGGIQLLLTCDTGITAHEPIDYAQKAGIPVIVTDHHDLPPQLPAAAALVNPKRLPDEHPLANLPGVGVAYLLAEALCRRLGQPDLVHRHLDLVALGIVADLALLHRDTRYLLQRGLAALRSTTRLGLQIMFELADLNPQNLTEEHISFTLGPRLNALGRLSDANRIVDLLTTTDSSRARILAMELEGLNSQRQLLTEQVFGAAQAQIEADPHILHEPVLVLSHPSWPAGVIGIVASRLVERYNRPVVMIAAPPGEIARGSARSIEGVNITAAIEANQNLLTNFGGHPMAAGLGILPENIPALRQALAKTVQRMVGEVQPQPDLRIDGYLPLSDLSLELVADLERLAPFGPGNPSLVLATRNLAINGYSAVGRHDEHMLITVEDETGRQQRSIWWQAAGLPLPDGRIDLAYTVRASTYRGQRDVQVAWVDYRAAEGAPVAIKSTPARIEIIDYRKADDPLSILRNLQAQKDVQIWCEAEKHPQLPGRDRLSLQPGQALAVWSIPPGPAELQEAIRRVGPATIYLFGHDPHMDQPEPFLRRLAGLVKFTLRAHQGNTTISALAAATAQRTSAVLSGLIWLQDHGYARLLQQNEDLITLASPETPGASRSPTTTAIKSMLEESAAYRAYYLHADKDLLIQP